MTTVTKSTSSDFWKDPEIANIYSKGGNEKQVSRYFQCKDWLSKHRVKEGESLLDVGSGTGEITALFSMMFFQVLGVDYSKPMVNYAQEYMRVRKIANVNIWNSDATNLDLPAKEGSIDRVVSFSAIHWFNDINKYFQGIKKYLKEDGKFFFRYAGCEGDESLELAEKMRQEDKWSAKFEGFTCPMHTHTPEAMRVAIKKVEMVCEKASIWENTETFRCQDDYKKYVAGWLPHLYSLDEEDREEFLNELIARHCARKDRCNDDGIVIVKDTQVEIWGYNQPVAVPVEKIEEEIVQVKNSRKKPVIPINRKNFKKYRFKHKSIGKTLKSVHKSALINKKPIR